MKTDQFSAQDSVRRAVVKLGKRHRDWSPPAGRQGASLLRRRLGGACLVLSLCLSLSILAPVRLRAGVVYPTFTASSPNITPGGTVDVSVTVDQFDLYSANFTLSWNSSVLTSATIVYQNPTLSSPGFNTSNSGYLTYSWFSGSETTLPANSTIFTVQFSAASGVSVGASSAVSFTDTPTARSVTLSDLSTGTPSNGGMFTVDGTVTVVPEPINYGLACFGLLYLAAIIIRRRHPLRRPYSTRTL